jgi:hypothetical protein
LFTIANIGCLTETTKKIDTRINTKKTAAVKISITNLHDDYHDRVFQIH